MKRNITKTSYAYILLAVIISGYMGFKSDSFLLAFINTLTLFSAIGLAMAFYRSNYISGDSSIHSFRTSPIESYSEYRATLKEERQHLKNPLLPASLFLSVVTVILTLLYHYNIL